MKNPLYIFSIILFSISGNLFAQDFMVKKDLRMDWVFLDKEENLMLPFLDNSGEFPTSIHLLLNADYGSAAYLKLSLPAGTGLFPDNKFVKHFEKDTTIFLLADSLINNKTRTPLQLTLYNKKSFKRPPEASIGFKHESFDASTNINPITERNTDRKNDYLKIIILVLFAFFVLLQSLFPSDLYEFLNLKTVVTFRYTETLISKYRSVTKTQILIIVYQAALLSGLILVFLNYYNNPLQSDYLLSINPIYAWLYVLGLVLLLFLFKYILISIFSFLFDLSDRINFYFIEFLRMSMVFYTILFLVISYILINKFYMVENILNGLIILIVAFNLLRFLLLYFKFRGIVAMKNLHLFSYLCTTELIPIIIGLRFFIK